MAGLSAAELHGLVDGFLDPERRADVLRRLAASPADRARVEAWQEQGEIIRNAFGEIEREPLPAALNLAPLFQSDTRPPPGSTMTGARLARVKIVAATILLAAAVVGGWATWTTLSQVTDPAERPLSSVTDATLAGRARSALANDGPAKGPPAAHADSGFTTVRIPDLAPSGFSLARVEAMTAFAGILVLHYRNGLAERLVISVAQADDDREVALNLIGDTYNWHHRDKAFALAGTVQPERLHDIAVLLQSGADRD